VAVRPESRRVRRTVVTACVVGLALAALSGCARKSAKGGGAVSSNATISIAVGDPLSGSYARAGLETLHAAQIAVDQVNAAGGINGHKVNVVQGDDQGDPATGQSVAQIFCDKSKVLGVIGHYNSGVTIPASTVYNKCGLAEVTPLSSNPQVTERGLGNVFRVGSRDDYLGPAVATYLATKTELRKVSVVDDQSAYGVGVAQQFTKTAQKRGLSIVGKAAIKAGDKDFRAVLGTLPKSTQALFFGGYPADAALLAQQAKEVGLNVVLAGGDGLYDPDFLKGGAAVEGSYVAASAGVPDAAAKQFLDTYQQKYGSPSGYGLLEYNATRLLLQALKDAKTLDRAGVIASLREVSYTPIQGGPPIQFDSKGDNKNALVHIFTVKSGAFSEIGTVAPSDFK
jgi:branched-chain amino acid transport system substrate-binding protein